MRYRVIAAIGLLFLVLAFIAASMHGWSDSFLIRPRSLISAVIEGGAAIMGLWVTVGCLAVGKRVHRAVGRLTALLISAAYIINLVYFFGQPFREDDAWAFALLAIWGLTTVPLTKPRAIRVIRS